MSILIRYFFKQTILFGGSTEKSCLTRNETKCFTTNNNCYKNNKKCRLKFIENVNVSLLLFLCLITRKTSSFVNLKYFYNKCMWNFAIGTIGSMSMLNIFILVSSLLIMTKVVPISAQPFLPNETIQYVNKNTIISDLPNKISLNQNDVSYSNNTNQVHYFDKNNLSSLHKYENNLMLLYNYSNNISIPSPIGPSWNHPLLGLLLITMTLVTIFGNVLVIIAVIKERYLKSATNYYIASLACADLLVGLIVMPFNSLNKMTNDFWFFGDIWCDLWHSFDVFGSTASINSLLFIALDRHSAISDPISYHTGWLTRYWVFFVAIIWIGSALISFPAIAYWRMITTVYIENKCIFPDDIYYSVFSSLVSFYIPLIIMVVVYIRIYRTATHTQQALKTGHKMTGETQLRIHRGKYHKLTKSIKTTATNTKTMLNNQLNSKTNLVSKPKMSSISENNIKKSNLSETKTKNKTNINKDVRIVENIKNSSSTLPQISSSVQKLKSKDYEYFKELKSNLKKRRCRSCNALINCDKTVIDLETLSSLKRKVIDRNKSNDDKNENEEDAIGNLKSINRKKFDLKKINDNSLTSLSSFDLKDLKTIDYIYYPSLITKNKSSSLKNSRNSKNANKISLLKSKFNMHSRSSLSVFNEKSPNKRNSLVALTLSRIEKNNPIDLNKESNISILKDENSTRKSESKIQFAPIETNSSECNAKNIEPLTKQSSKNKFFQKANMFVQSVKFKNRLLSSIHSNGEKSNQSIIKEEISEEKTITQYDYDLYTLSQIKLVESNSFINKTKNNLPDNNFIMKNGLKLTSSNYQLNLAIEFYQNHYYEHISSIANSNDNENNLLKSKNSFDTMSINEKKKNIFFKWFLNSWNVLSKSKKNEEKKCDDEKINEPKCKKMNWKTMFKERVKGIKIGNKLRKFSREQKAAKTLGIVMGIFIICWLPFFLYNVITGLFKAKSHDFIYSLLTWLGYANSGCNPIIYAFSSKDFRRAFSKILCSFRFRKKAQNDNSRKMMYLKNMRQAKTLSVSKSQLSSTSINFNEYFETLKCLKPSEELNKLFSSETDNKILCDLCQTYESLYLKFFEANKSEIEKKYNMDEKFRIITGTRKENVDPLLARNDELIPNTSLTNSPFPSTYTASTLPNFSTERSVQSLKQTVNNSKSTSLLDMTKKFKLSSLTNSINRRLQTKFFIKRNNKRQNWIYYNPNCPKRYIANAYHFNSQLNQSSSSINSLSNLNNINSKMYQLNSNGLNDITKEDYVISGKNKHNGNTSLPSQSIKIGTRFVFKQINLDKNTEEKSNNENYFYGGEIDNDEDYFLEINSNIMKKKQTNVNINNNLKRNDLTSNIDENDDLRICIDNFKALIENLKETYVDEINNTNNHEDYVFDEFSHVTRANNKNTDEINKITLLPDNKNDFINYFEI